MDIVNDPESSLILFARRGSHTYGTNIEGSDEDLIGVILASKRHYLGFPYPESFQAKINGNDNVFYELKKFFSLCINFNPNVIESLWCREEDVLIQTDFGKELRANRNMFNSKKAYNALCGYAQAQKSRIIGANTGQLGQKRKDLIAAYGYDTKYAMHALRLLLMCYDFFDKEMLVVHRGTDSQFLLDVRNGKYPLNFIENHIEAIENDIQKLYEKSDCPVEPDYEKINDFMVSMLERHLWKTN